MMPVSELLAVKIELTACKIQQLQAAYQQLIDQQRALVEQVRAFVGAPHDHIYNIDTRSFQPPAPRDPIPLSTTATRQAKRAQRD